VSVFRRFFDLQAQTIWRDLAFVLPRLAGTLVDVGCGAQPYRRLLAGTVRYVGIDAADAKTTFGYEAPDTRYYDGHTWPIDDAYAEAVLATETLEHIIDPDEFLREAYRSLKPAGQLILTVPFAARWHFIPADFWRFTPSGLSHILTKAGFVEIAVYARGNGVTVAAYKCLSLMTGFVLPQSNSVLRSLALRAVGAVVFPLFLACAITGNLSLLAGDGDDCLGYTAIARKPSKARASDGS
jgi:SAM-dependent methyltransferase